MIIIRLASRSHRFRRVHVNRRYLSYPLGWSFKVWWFRHQREPTKPREHPQSLIGARASAKTFLLSPVEKESRFNLASIIPVVCLSVILIGWLYWLVDKMSISPIINRLIEWSFTIRGETTMGKRKRREKNLSQCSNRWENDHIWFSLSLLPYWIDRIERQRSHYVRASDFEYIYLPIDTFPSYPPTVHQAEDARARTFHKIFL